VGGSGSGLGVSVLEQEATTRNASAKMDRRSFITFLLLKLFNIRTARLPGDEDFMFRSKGTT
jgi:hypothetical protein